MIEWEDFFKDKSELYVNGKYKHLVYHDPDEQFKISLDYNYIYGWSSTITFEEAPLMTIVIENCDDDVTKLLEALNRCLPLKDKKPSHLKFKTDIKSYLGHDKFELSDFNVIRNDEDSLETYTYYDPTPSLFRIGISESSSYPGKYKMIVYFKGLPITTLTILVESVTVEQALDYLNKYFSTFNVIYDALIPLIWV